MSGGAAILIGLPRQHDEQTSADRTFNYHKHYNERRSMTLRKPRIVVRRDPAGGAYDAPPDPLVGWGGGKPLPILLRRFGLGGFGASILAPSRSGLAPPQIVNPCAATAPTQK